MVDIWLNFDSIALYRGVLNERDVWQGSTVFKDTSLWPAHVWNESAEWICESVKVKFDDPGRNALMVIKYKLHGSFSISQWKRKGRTPKTFKSAVPVTVHICCKCCHPCVHARACVCGQVFSGGVQLFCTGIPAHLARWISLGSRGWPQQSRDQDKSRTLWY